MTDFSRAALATIALLAAWSCAGPQQTVALTGVGAEIDASQYPTLQAALGALPETGGVVRIPSGHFQIEEPLRLTRGETTIEGAGAATHIENLNTDGRPALLIEHPTAEAPRPEDGLWRIRIANLRITGNPKSGHGVEARYIQELFIEGLTVSHHGGDGIRLDHCIEDARVSDSLITYNAKSGLLIDGNHDTIISANQFEENSDAIHSVDGYNLTVTGNNLDDHLGDGIVLDNFYGSVISGNMIEQSKGTGIVLARGSYGVTVSANIVIHNEGGGIDLRSTHSSTVSANTLASNVGFGVRASSEAEHVTVSGNTFSGEFTTPDGFDRPADGGLSIEDRTSAVVSGNRF